MGVVQVDDAAAADDGLTALSGCAGADDEFGWSIAGDWAVIAASTAIAEQVTDAAADDPLSRDDDFERWIGEAGDPGILTAYAAPEAGALLADAATGLVGLPELAGGPVGLPEQLRSGLADFQGAAVTVRFADGGLEVEAASGSAPVESGPTGFGGDGGDDVVTTLPADTAIALGVGLEEGWFDAISASTDQVLGQGGLEDLLALAEDATGLDLPDDLETLLGDSTAVALGGDADLTAFGESAPPADLPLGVKVHGDTDDISEILDTLLSRVDDPSLSSLLAHDADGDHVVAGPSADYRATLLDDGGLGSTDAYRDAVIDGDDAAAVLFVDVGAGSWLTSLPGLPDEVRRNLEPLGALGLTARTDDGVSHVALRITTD